LLVLAVEKKKKSKQTNNQSELEKTDTLPHVMYIS
jgi:hypothetical protein